MLLAGARVVTPDQVLDDGWVEIDGSRIVAVGAGRPPGTARALPEGSWLVPGFIDLHVHGGGGAWMTTGDADEVLAAAAFHQAHGTTRTLASLVTAPVDAIERGAAAIATVVEAGAAAGAHVVGCHLEGPFLSAVRCGAQDPRHLIAPDVELLGRMLDAGRGTVRVVTIAPELPGAFDLITATAAAGAIAAIGHTDATYEVANAAIAAGARLATHLCNAMPPLQHRAPGAVGAALRSRDVVCEVINDGAHLHDGMVATIVAAAGPRRVALITDAIAAAGTLDGTYELGGREVRVEHGVARLADGGALAGSTLTMDVAVRRAVNDIGLSVADAVVAASTTPARVLGLADRAGAITPGLDADLVVLDADLHVVAVMVLGRWVGGPLPSAT